MRWEDERYVRVYTRDTAEWLALGWEGQALLLLLLRKADRAGIIQTGKAGVRGVAALAGMPLDMVQRALPILLEDGCLREMVGGYVFPNFLAAQEARASDAQRKREQRARDRDKAVAGGATGSRSGLDAEAAAERASTAGVVYVVRAGTKVKVGFTASGMDARFRQYLTHSPDAVLLAHGPGTLEDERSLHAVLGVKTRAGEWCTPADNVLRHVLSCVTPSGVVVTPCSHTDGVGVTDVTESVTPSRAVPSRAVPSRAVPSASQAPAAPPEDDLPDGTAFALEAQEAPAPAAKRPRETPRGEVLYTLLEANREQECERAGVPYVPSRWPFSRQNKDLGPIAKLPDGHAEKARFQAAWDAFLDDPAARGLDEPFSLNFFWKCRSRYEGRGLKAVAS